jgi:dTDP-4-dehydrorhamnose reductase
VLGATGLLGSVIYHKFQVSHEVYGTYFKSPVGLDNNFISLDASDLSQLTKIVMQIRPSLVINCVGLTTVELCEMQPEASWKLKSEIPARLAKISSSMGIRLIHISTDHFASKKSEPRTESELVFPINIYGHSKYCAERFILEYDPNALILRTNFFTRDRVGSKSLLDFAIKATESQDEVIGFNDVLFSPVGATEIANFLLDHRSDALRGILNFASTEVISKFDFLTLVANVLGVDGSRVVRGSISDSVLSVIRPNYLALNPFYLNHHVGYKLPSIELMLRTELNSTHIG